MTNDTVNPSQQPPRPADEVAAPAAASPTSASLATGPEATTAAAPGSAPAHSPAAKVPAGEGPAADAGTAQAPQPPRAPHSNNNRRGGRRSGAARAAPQDSAAPGAVPGNEARPAAGRRPLPPLLDQLAEWHPQLFGAQFLPLKRGIFHDLMAAHGEAIDKNELKQALAIHTRSTRYLTAVASGQARHDLQAQPVEAMAPEHVHHALLEVFRRRKPRDGAEGSERLRRRIAQAFEASGLTRMAYDALVRGRDEQANALLDEALAEVAERDARAEALLRAYEASGATSEAFADMYGMERQQVGQSLARARRLREAAAAEAAAAEVAAAAPPADPQAGSAETARHAPQHAAGQTGPADEGAGNTTGEPDPA